MLLTLALKSPLLLQATLNLFCDMGVLPGVQELGGGLVLPSPSSDSSPPTISQTSPSSTSSTSSTTFSSSLTVTGMASDTGGLVAAVEYRLSSGKLQSGTNSGKAAGVVWKNLP